MTHTLAPTDILNFWYSPPMSEHWFSSTPAIDDEIRSRFEQIWEQARAGRLDHWRQSAEGCLALCIILDQFPLNMFRGHPQSFSTEQQAVAVTRHAVAQGFHQQLPQAQLSFLFMPLMHSENMEDQHESLRLFEAAGLKDNLRFARHHFGIVERYGRFPHRNAILGRSSTPEERAYLASDEAFTG
ncbi:MAG: DUF924 family protein [Thiolinea sp.]